jgi:zinc protease
MSHQALLERLSMPLERFELSCGALLCVSPRPGAPVCAIQAHVRGGPALDPRGKEGLAYLVGALADQGTPTRSDEEIAALLEPHGGELGGDASGLAGVIVGSRWKLLLEVLCDALSHAHYPNKLFERQRQRLLDRLRVERSEPQKQGALLFRQLVYGDHWMGRAAYGDSASIERIEPAEVRALRRRHWCGRRLILSVCGDVDPKEVRAACEKLLADLAPGAPLETVPPVFPALGRRVRTFGAERKQVHVFLGHLGIRRNDPDYPALVVMDHVLGTGPGFVNRISRRLRDELGLAYSVHASIHSSAGILPGVFSAYIGTSPKHAETAIDGFLAEMDRMRSELVPEEELETAKQYLLGSFAMGFERASRRAAYMTSSAVHGWSADHLPKLMDAFAATTQQDVRRVAQAHLHPERCCLAVAGPLKANRLAKYAGG